ncbi:TIGR02594 family protein [uncultured Winogradskyella sp.]|uniref:C40 family peptidase n=1 Tax=uncultured Winogradskyella sp. TaxID=395353 RepID=UPI00261F0E55|nr:TIGR02594 family protein [uncultured Winogradskyella sp.]
MGNLMQIASAEIGVKEVRGSRSNPQIIRYAEESGFNNYRSDETAWCSLFTNWVAYKAGLERTNSLWARSWLNVGVPVSDPEPGDIVVFWRESRNSRKGHVGFFQGFSEDKSRVYCLGGNQRDMVSITAKPIEQVLGYRRLRFVNEITFSRKNLKRGDRGTEVVKLQDILKQLGFNCGTSDGIFGPKTEQCIKDLQATSENLEITGILDSKTKAYIQEVKSQDK